MLLLNILWLSNVERKFDVCQPAHVRHPGHGDGRLHLRPRLYPQAKEESRSDSQHQDRLPTGGGGGSGSLVQTKW